MIASLNSTNTLLSLFASILTIAAIVIGAVRWGVNRLDQHVKHEVDRAVKAVREGAVYGQGNREMLVSQQEKLGLPIAPLVPHEDVSDASPSAGD